MSQSPASGPPSLCGSPPFRTFFRVSPRFNKPPKHKKKKPNAGWSPAANRAYSVRSVYRPGPAPGHSVDSPSRPQEHSALSLRPVDVPARAKRGPISPHFLTARLINSSRPLAKARSSTVLQVPREPRPPPHPGRRRYRPAARARAGARRLTPGPRPLPSANLSLLFRRSMPQVTRRPSRGSADRCDVLASRSGSHPAWATAHPSSVQRLATVIEGNREDARTWRRPTASSLAAVPACPWRRTWYRPSLLLIPDGVCGHGPLLAFRVEALRSRPCPTPSTATDSRRTRECTPPSVRYIEWQAAHRFRLVEGINRDHGPAQALRGCRPAERARFPSCGEGLWSALLRRSADQ